MLSKLGRGPKRCTAYQSSPGTNGVNSSLLAPTPLTPSPCLRGPSDLGHQGHGEGVGFFKGDGGGFATPISLGTLSPLSARSLQQEGDFAAERPTGLLREGVRGVRCEVRSPKMIHSLLEG